MRRRVPDASKLFAYTGFRPQIGLDQTLREVIAYETSPERLEASPLPLHGGGQS
jgi:nucleoside-diphosphate-sugar epimerase